MSTICCSSIQSEGSRPLFGPTLKEVVSLECKHRFHCQCVKQWLAPWPLRDPLGEMRVALCSGRAARVARARGRRGRTEGFPVPRVWMEVWFRCSVQHESCCASEKQNWDSLSLSLWNFLGLHNVLELWFQPLIDVARCDATPTQMHLLPSEANGRVVHRKGFAKPVLLTSWKAQDIRRTQGYSWTVRGMVGQ